MPLLSPSPITLRRGTPADLPQLAAMYARCSEESLARRFHSPVPAVPPGLLRSTLEPRCGWSLLAVLHEELVGISTVGALSALDLEVGTLVRDDHQGRGIGTRLLCEVAGEASARGYRTLVCLTQPDNVAVHRSVARSGLPARSTTCDGLETVTIGLVASG